MKLRHEHAVRPGQLAGSLRAACGQLAAPCQACARHARLPLIRGRPRLSQVKLRGYRLELGEIEAAALAAPGVRLAAALVCTRGGAALPLTTASARMSKPTVAGGSSPASKAVKAVKAVKAAETAEAAEAAGAAGAAGAAKADKPAKVAQAAPGAQEKAQAVAGAQGASAQQIAKRAKEKARLPLPLALP